MRARMTRMLAMEGPGAHCAPLHNTLCCVKPICTFSKIKEVPESEHSGTGFVYAYCGIPCRGAGWRSGTLGIIFSSRVPRI